MNDPDWQARLTEAAISSHVRSAAAEIRASGLFDEYYYRLHYGPEIAGSGLDDPAIHYLVFGHARGFNPGPGFDTSFYVENNPDTARPEANPLIHYIRHGAAQGRRPRPEMRLPDLDTLRAGIRSVGKLAVAAHVYYPEVWAELAAQINAIPEPCDIFVSLTAGRSDHLAQDIAKQFPHAAVAVFPNHGRDVFPFVSMLAAGLFDGYEWVLKLHTKASQHRVDGPDWRRTLVSSLLGGEERITTLLAAMRDNPALGMVCPDGNLGNQQFWGANRTRTLSLARRLQIAPRDEDLRFSIGTMFWVRPSALRLLKLLDLGPATFEPERGDLDGTTAHALERLFGIVCHEAGLTITCAGDILKQQPILALPPATACATCLAIYRTGINSETRIWDRVADATPAFDGHRQPRKPGTLGYYDERVAEIAERQIALARKHGFAGFCHIHRFDNPAPLTLRFQNRTDFTHCLVWDNVNDTVPAADLADLAAPWLASPAAVRWNGAPILIVAAPQRVDAGDVVQWRAKWKRMGLPPVHLLAVTDLRTMGSTPAGWDAWLPWPQANDAPLLDITPAEIAPEFAGSVRDYAALADRMCGMEAPAGHRIVSVGFDDTPRNGRRATILFGANPERFRRWLASAALTCDGEKTRLVFVDSWNDWDQGANLEPDTSFGTMMLDTVRSITGA